MSQDWKMSVFIPVSKKGNAKECSDLPYQEVLLISHASNVMFNICQARLQELPDSQDVFRKKGEEPDSKLPVFLRS